VGDRTKLAEGMGDRPIHLLFRPKGSLQAAPTFKGLGWTIMGGSTASSNGLGGMKGRPAGVEQVASARRTICVRRKPLHSSGMEEIRFLSRSCVRTPLT